MQKRLGEEYAQCVPHGRVESNELHRFVFRSETQSRLMTTANLRQAPVSP